MNRLLTATILLSCFALSACGQSNKEPATLRTLLNAGLKTNKVEALQAIKAVLKENPELVLATNKSGWTPLFFGVMGGNTNVVEAMLSYKAQVNVRNTNGDTPLHFASGFWGRKEVASLLLANKAEVNAVNQSGQTPLLKAAMVGRSDVAALLIANKADVNAKDGDGRMPLHFAATRADRMLAELLLTNGADVNAKDNDGNTPLHLLTKGRAAWYVAELMNESHTVTNFRAPNGSIIIRNPHDEMVKLLFQRGGHE
jgi:ankyrin repeat protein